MIRYFNKPSIFWLFFFILIITNPCIADDDDYNYIDIDNPSSRKIPIAIPVFVDTGGSSTGSPVFKQMSDLMVEALVFTRYFNVIDRGAYLIDPDNPAITRDKVNFQNWSTIGAEFLVTGGLKLSGNNIKLELRLFDTVKGKRLVGKGYRGTVSDQRQIIHRFCSEIVRHFTGNRGIFNSKIAFVSTGTGNKEIYTCDFDGHSPQQFTNNKSINMSPDWSSDGKYLAYTSFLKRKPDIYIKDLKKQEKGAVIAKKGLNISPAWRPGKFVLAATLSFSGAQKIYLLTGTGKVIRKLTRNWGSDLSPTWSPDGQKIAFVSDRSGHPHIYVMDVNTGETERLTFHGKYNTQPNWSPRGDRITYSSIEKGSGNIYVIGIEDQDPIRLTGKSGNNESPTWSPDGSLIAFSSTREGRSRIFVMTSYGTDQKRLLALPGKQSNPKWSPSFTK